MPTFLRPSLEKIITSLFRNVRHVDFTSEGPKNGYAKSNVWAIYQPIEKVKHFLIPIKIIIRTHIKNTRKLTVCVYLQSKVWVQNSPWACIAAHVCLVLKEAEYQQVNTWTKIIWPLYTNIRPR